MVADQRRRRGDWVNIMFSGLHAYVCITIAFEPTSHAYLLIFVETELSSRPCHPPSWAWRGEWRSSSPRHQLLLFSVIDRHSRIGRQLAIYVAFIGIAVYPEQSPPSIRPQSIHFIRSSSYCFRHESERGGCGDIDTAYEIKVLVMVFYVCYVHTWFVRAAFLRWRPLFSLGRHLHILQVRGWW